MAFPENLTILYVCDASQRGKPADYGLKSPGKSQSRVIRFTSTSYMRLLFDISTPIKDAEGTGAVADR